MVKILFLVLLVYTFYRGVRGNFRIIHSIRSLGQIQRKVLFVSRTNEGDTEKQVFILIPVLREQEIIEQTFDRFSSLEGDYQLIFITTQREDHEVRKYRKTLVRLKDKILATSSLGEFQELMNGIFPLSVSKRLFVKTQSLTDKEMVWKLILEEYERKKHTRDILHRKLSSSSQEIANKVRIIDYPDKDGVMAHQLNYACTKIMEEQQELSDIYIAVYNADSLISKTWVSELRNYLAAYSNAKVIQQSSLFLLNFNDFGKGRSGDMLRGVALLQTRWTLAHEIPRLLKQFRSRVGAFFEGAHVVGHGLIIRLDTLIDVGMFPTNFINEDLPLGYLIRLQGEIIYLFHYLENSESPSTVKSMFNQYRTWFYGAANYPQYMKYAWKMQVYSRIKVVIWGAKYVVRALFWLSSSFVWLFLFIYPLIARDLFLFGLSVLTFFVYAPLSFIVMTNLLNKHGQKLTGMKWKPIKVSISMLVMSLIVYITHSYGPTLATIDILEKLLLNKEIYKHKTER